MRFLYEEVFKEALSGYVFLRRNVQSNNIHLSWKFEQVPICSLGIFACRPKGCWSIVLPVFITLNPWFHTSETAGFFTTYLNLPSQHFIRKKYISIMLPSKSYHTSTSWLLIPREAELQTLISLELHIQYPRCAQSHHQWVNTFHLRPISFPSVTGIRTRNS